ncbi:MAG: acyl-CoA dehydrogenase family protein [Myxococcota bacterium]
MDLEITEEQLELRDNYRAVLEEYCSTDFVRRVYEQGDDASSLWKQTTELGWPALNVPESAGGLGYGFVEVGLLAEELGRAAAPAQLLCTTTQFTPALIAANASDVLGRVAEGQVRGALAFAERGSPELAGLQTRATRDGDGWLLSGKKDWVMGAVTADLIAVVARDVSSAHLGLFLVERASAGTALQVTPNACLDAGLFCGDLLFESTPATALIEPGPGAAAQLEEIGLQAAAAMALHTVGACRRLFEMTLEYAKVRKQYDRVIGSFQALKHRFAEMYLSVERATALCYYASVALAEGDDVRAEAVHLAKSITGDTQDQVVEDSLQLHGGLGYTWEQDLHFWLKRGKSGELFCGSAAWHRAQVAQSLGLLSGGQS